MATMNVSLPADMVAFVDEVMVQGGYSSSSEVVREALRLLQHEKAVEAEKIAVLRREIAVGLDAAAKGQFSDKTVSEIAAGVLARHGHE